MMTNQEKGATFEIITRDFFVWLFEKMGFVVTKNRIQFSGTQNGFDIVIIISRNYIEHRIYIECKNYITDLQIGNILKKTWDLSKSTSLEKKDLFIAINPKSMFKNEDNSERSTVLLNEVFKFKSLLLDTSNGVKELFGLNGKFYKQIYGQDVDFDIDEEREIERFKEIIFSQKPFKKIIITEKHKNDFIGATTNQTYYIERFLLNDVEKEFAWNFRAASMTLSDIVNTEDKIFILGNPGLGKSTELKKLALDFWKEGEVDGFVPIFKNLRNFTNTDDLYNFLPSNWTELNNILLILDGIDEISYIEYFKSKLENFINKEGSEKQIKYVISCRTNIYESLVSNIMSFKVFYLKNLTLDQSLKLLEKSCDFPINNEEIAAKFEDYLKTPFHIKIFANFINQKNSLPCNIAELWKNYIDNRLSSDRYDKLKKLAIDVQLIKKYSRKTSLINELMKTNSFSEENLFSIVKEDSIVQKEFLKNPLLDIAPSTETWFFEHRNIQEYFAADVISRWSIEEIINFICIKGTNKTHPSLFNTITFLINLLAKDSDELKDVIAWLKANQIEILFRADSDRTESFQVEVFQHYFKMQCIDKKLWISTNKTFSVKEIGEFGDCDDNFKYLFKIINNQECLHFRVVISALNLLAFFKPNHKREGQLKPLFIEFLASHNIGANVKSQIIRCIESLQFCTADGKYLDEIFSVFKTESNKEINASLLFLISEIQDVDKLFWYIKAEFLREAGIVNRNDADEVHRGNNWKLNELTLKLEKSAHFMDIVSFYFFENHSIELENDFAIRILERCLFFAAKEKDFIVNLLENINRNTKYYNQERLLINIITQSNKQFDAAKYLIDNNNFSDVRDFISNFATIQILEFVLNRFKSTHVSSEEINYFRNNLWHSNREASYVFQALMNSDGFVFSSIIPTIIELEDQQNTTLKKIQKNFDILFNKTLLLSAIEHIYSQNNIAELDIRKSQEINAKWRIENNYPSYFDNSLAILQSLLRNYRILTFYQVVELLNNEVIVFKILLDSIKCNTNVNVKFVVSEEQQKIIIDWCTITSAKINFDNIAVLYKENSFSFKSDYLNLETILSFQKHLVFSLSKDFLLNCLEYWEIINFNEKDNPLSFLFDKIDDKKLFDKKIVDNIKNKTLLKAVLTRHIDYALKNKLKEVLPHIRKYFLEEKSLYNLDNNLELYISLSDDIDLLKECCTDINEVKCWSAIKILTSKNEKDFCINSAVAYLRQENMVIKDYFVSNAMQVLFHFKSIEALEAYLNLPNFDFHAVNFSDYSTIEDYSILATLFFKIFNGDYDRYGFNYGSSFFTAYVSNLSKIDEISYDKTLKVLHSIKRKLILANSDNRLFYVNNLIDDSTNSYTNSKSIPLSFKEALAKVECTTQ
jgi:hypothetical protein